MQFFIPTIILFLFFLHPAFCELTNADLNKIELIMNRAIQPLTEDVAVMKTEIQNINKGMDTSTENFNKRFEDINSQFNRIFWLLVGILTSAVGLVTTFLIYVVRVIERSNNTVDKTMEVIESTESLIETMKQIRDAYQEQVTLITDLAERLTQSIEEAKKS